MGSKVQWPKTTFGMLCLKQMKPTGFYFRWIEQKVWKLCGLEPGAVSPKGGCLSGFRGQSSKNNFRYVFSDVKEAKWLWFCSIPAIFDFLWWSLGTPGKGWRRGPTKLVPWNELIRKLNLSFLKNFRKSNWKSFSIRVVRFPFPDS